MPSLQGSTIPIVTANLTRWQRLQRAVGVYDFWRQEDPPEFAWRLFRYFGAARILVALTIYLLLSHLENTTGDSGQIQALITSLLYLLLSLFSLLWLVYRPKYFYPQLAQNLVLDLIALTICYTVLPKFQIEFAILFLLPILSAAVLGTLTTALFAASFVSLVILYIALRGVFFSTSSELGVYQSGVYGLAFMAIALLMRALAKRQITQEVLAEESQRSLHLQQIIHHLMVHDMQDGVLLVKNDGEIMASNSAARELIGLKNISSDIFQLGQKTGANPKLLQTIQHLPPLFEAMQNWQMQPEDTPITLALFQPQTEIGNKKENHANSIKVRIRFVKPTLTGKEKFSVFQNTLYPRFERKKVKNQEVGISDKQINLSRDTKEKLSNTVLIYLESWEKVSKQTQQEKLAAMGRLVAGIAHEIRNPLAAISHANELLLDEINHPERSIQLNQNVQIKKTDLVPQRMLHIIADNVKRLDHIVSEILSLSRRPSGELSSILLSQTVREIIEQWQINLNLNDEVMPVNDKWVIFRAEENLSTTFHRTQLEQVLNNLLDNAWRYCKKNEGSIIVSIEANNHKYAELMVWNDGPEITPAIEKNLFEPFFTSEAQGTGLGLYLARELCHANQAQIYYVPIPPQRLYSVLPALVGEKDVGLNRKAFLIKMLLNLT